MGVRPINAFHHEARLLPNGNFLVLADNEQILTDLQGPGAVDVIGDEILVLDSNLQVIWAWDAFDHLDISRMAVLGETCPSGAGCAPYYLSPTANDWLHGNSLQLTPDGQILYSSRHQDWIFKINYDSGSGDGHVIWRLGNDGDFQIVSSDPYPWFSHQHEANYAQTPFGLSLLVFDNGDTRIASNPDENSRGQVIQLEEQELIATLEVNADLGVYAFALGTAESLPGGTFHFDAGWITQDALAGANASRSIEVDSSGNVLYGVAINTPEYRTIRMQDLYTPASVDQP
jgi:arylsulfate sulfotransferase